MSWRRDPEGSGKGQNGTWNSRTRETEWRFERFYVWVRLSDGYVNGTCGRGPGAGFRILVVTDDWYGVAVPVILAARQHLTP